MAKRFITTSNVSYMCSMLVSYELLILEIWTTWKWNEVVMHLNSEHSKCKYYILDQDLEELHISQRGLLIGGYDP